MGSTINDGELPVGEKLSNFLEPARRYNGVACAANDKGGYMHRREMFFDAVAQGITEGVNEAAKANLEVVEGDDGKEGERFARNVA